MVQQWRVVLQAAHQSIERVPLVLPTGDYSCMPGGAHEVLVTYRLLLAKELRSALM